MEAMMSRILRVVLIGLMAVWTVYRVVPSHAAQADMFLQLEEIHGESADDGH